MKKKPQVKIKMFKNLYKKIEYAMEEAIYPALFEAEKAGLDPLETEFVFVFIEDDEDNTPEIIK